MPERGVTAGAALGGGQAAFRQPVSLPQPGPPRPADSEAELRDEKSSSSHFVSYSPLRCPPGFKTLGYTHQRTNPSLNLIHGPLLCSPAFQRRAAEQRRRINRRAPGRQMPNGLSGQNQITRTFLRFGSLYSIAGSLAEISLMFERTCWRTCLRRPRICLLEAASSTLLRASRTTPWAEW